ncbi:DUF895 domain membrane protein, partial [Irineochytrium annulatum]
MTGPTLPPLTALTAAPALGQPPGSHWTLASVEGDISTAWLPTGPKDVPHKTAASENAPGSQSQSTLTGGDTTAPPSDAGVGMDYPLTVDTIRVARAGEVAVLVLGCAFFLIFMAFSVVQNLASTVLTSSVAYSCFGSLYIAFAFSNLLGAAVIVEHLGTRPSLVFASLSYVVMNVAMIFAVKGQGDDRLQFAVLLPACLLIGFGASVLWTAQGTYLSRCGTPETTGHLSGIFTGIQGMANVIGPLLSSVLLQFNVDKNLMFVILTACGAGGPVIFAYMWSRPEPKVMATLHPEAEPETIKPPSVWSTVRIMRNASMLLIFPLFVTYALEQEFYSGVFSLFITTGNEQTDLRNKLFLFATWGASQMATCFLVGKVTDRLGARVMTWVVAIVHSGAMIALSCAGPLNNLPLLFSVAFLLGVTDAILINQIFKLLHQLFPSDSDMPAAYSASWFVRSLFMGI